MSLIQMSFSGAVMILVIAVIRAVLILRLPKQLFILLWEMVLLRLLIPFSIPSPLSVYTLARGWLSGGNVAGPSNPAAALIPQTAAVQADTGAAGTQIWESGVAEGVVYGNGSIFMCIWLIGALVCAGFFAVSYRRCYREFRTSLPFCSEAAARWLGKHPLRREVQLRQSDRVSTPLTYGIRKPVILLPAGMDWEDEQRLNYILLHEHIHIRHFDTTKKMVMVSVLCVHWFNPLVWVMYLLFNRDMELACDEGVVRQSGANSRKAYANTLIRMEEKRSMVLPFCNYFSENVVRERIRAIMKTKKLTMGIVVLCAGILGAVTILFATSADSRRQAEEPEGTSAARESEINLAGESEDESGNMEEIEEAEVRAGTTVLSYLIEGNTEETPATLYAGDGFSLYIPDEGWQIYDENPVEPEKMSAVYLPSEGQIGLWVEYYETGVSDTESVLLEEGYVPGAERGRLQRQDGDVLTEVRLFDGENAAWAVCSRRPATVEGAEGASVRLETIAGTFALTPGKPDGAGQSAGVSDGEQAALRDLAADFYTAYFSGDAEGIKPYLYSAFEGTPEVYDGPDPADAIAIHEIKIPEETDTMAGRCSISVEFTVPGEDSYTYLSMELVKEHDGWKVRAYGLEK